MISINFPSSAEVVRQLVNPAARSIMLACCAGLALAALRTKSTSVRLFAWQAVLYAALAMPLLGWVLPAITIAAPSALRFADHSIVASSNHGERFDVQPPAAIHSRTNRSAARVPVQASTVKGNGALLSIQNAILPRQPSESPLDWSLVAVAIYLFVASVLLIRMAIGLFLARRVKRTAKEIRDERIKAHLARCARSFGIATITGCRESEAISVPLTMGVLRPAIFLPTSWRKWDDAKLEAVIAHEMSHVARRDALTQQLWLLHRAFFWFSPLAWWLDRRLAELAEQVSDEAALSCGADSNEYANTLLGFFETLHAAPGRVWWQGVAMAKVGQAERRLERILEWKNEGEVTMPMKKSAALAILALAVPAVFLAASVRPSQDRMAPQVQELAAPAAPAKPSAAMRTENLPAPSDPAVAPSPEAAVAPPALATSAGAFPSPAPMAPMAPVSPLAPPAAWSSQSHGSGNSYSYSYGYDDEDRFVIVKGNSDSLTMSGSTQDAHHVERLRKQIPGDFIWFQRDEKSYVIRDQATIDRARGFWAPQEELGRKQEELGKQQEALGKQQEAIGHKMEQVRVNVPDMSAELEKLKAELKALGPTATQEQLGNIQSEIGDLQSKIGDVQSKAGDQQSKIGEEMSALGDQQGKLGEQQGELGRQQEKLAKEAARKMKELFDESIKNGKAQPEPPTSQSGTI